MVVEIWVLITIAAAFLQNIRSTFQKYLKGEIGTAGATFVRFGFGLPFAFLFLFFSLNFLNLPLPKLHGVFLSHVVVAALCQIIAQLCLIQMFSYKNFAAGTAYSRTEPAQAALFGLIFLGDKISLFSLIAIAISVFGVMVISIARTAMVPSALLTSIFSKTTLIGLTSGMFFGLSAVNYRGASLSLEGPHFVIQGGLTLCTAITLQSVVLFLFLKFRRPQELRKLRGLWKPALLVGGVGASASFGWFMAMTLQTAAVVKGLAQIEVLFTFVSSILFFGETINRKEFIGIFAITFGIFILLFGDMLFAI